MYENVWLPPDDTDQLEHPVRPPEHEPPLDPTEPQSTERFTVAELQSTLTTDNLTTGGDDGVDVVVLVASVVGATTSGALGVAPEDDPSGGDGVVDAGPDARDAAFGAAAGAGP